MILEIFLLAFSLVLLYFGADWLVGASSRLGIRAGLSPLVIGLTIVAMGTSMPELFVTIQAALGGVEDMAVGNVVGSNIFNIAIILGIAACIHPTRVHLALVRRDVPIMIMVTLIACVMFLDHAVSRIEGFFLVLGIISYMLYSLIVAGKESPPESMQAIPIFKHFWFLDALIVMVSIGILSWGSQLLVTSASSIAMNLGVGETLIGLTVVAAGTSMPELVTSVVAAYRKQSDIAVGNVVGSNIYNILCILGISSVIHPLNTENISTTDLIALVLSAVLVWPLLYTGKILSRMEGSTLVFAYLVYLTLLIIMI